MSNDERYDEDGMERRREDGAAVAVVGGATSRGRRRRRILGQTDLFSPFLCLLPSSCLPCHPSIHDSRLLLYYHSPVFLDRLFASTHTSCVLEYVLRTTGRRAVSLPPIATVSRFISVVYTHPTEDSVKTGLLDFASAGNSTDSQISVLS